MTGICIALLILLYPFHPSSVYGQTSAITMPTNVTLGQNDLNITCTPSSGFKSVLVISLQRTHSNITSSIVIIHANKVTWNAKYSVKHRSILKGQDCTPPVLEVFIAKDKILLSDAGLYSCVVIGHTSTNDIYHATSREQLLTVIVPVTTLTLTPNNEVNVIEYEAVNISCETDLCRPAANIIWYKDNVLVNDNIIQSQRSYGDKYKTTSILTLIGDKREQKREIYCNASNLPNILPVKSNVITINVLSPAEFDQNFYIFHLQLFSPMSITVPFYSNPPAQMSGVEWINKTGHSNTVVRPSDDISLSLVNADIGMKTKKGQEAVMNITSVQRGHAGNYSLRIVNGATLISSVDLWFVLFEKPQVPSNVTVICKNSGAELSWISGENGGFNQVFQVLYKQEDESNFRTHHEKYKDTGEGRLVHATVPNITPRVIYNFKIIAIILHVNISSEPKNCIILGKEPSSTANLGGVVGGITSAFIVIIIIISIAFILKLRGFCVFNRHRGSPNANERSSEDKYDDILQPAETNIHSYTTGSTSDKTDDRSTYEELQSTREVHTYGDVETGPAYSNLAVE